MASKFSPETDSANKWGERGASQRVLLLVLLLLVAVGGYLYFFTGLIKPREEVAKSAPTQPATVKMPIPPRPDQPAQEASVAKPGEKKTGEGVQGKPAPPPAPAPAKPAAPAKPVPPPQVQPASPQPVPPQPVTPPVKPRPAPVPTKPETAKPAKPAAPATAKAPAPAPAATKPVPAKKEAKPAVPVQAAAPKEARPAKKAGTYALRVGAFVAEPSLKEALTKLKKAGIAPVRKAVEKKPEPMNRLFVATFSDRDEAAAEVAKLKKATSDAFVLPENGTYTVYAGSYFLDAKAAAEQDRLYDKGVKTLMKKSQVAVTVTKVTAGAFPSRGEAQKAAERLKKQGLTAMVVKTGK